MSDLHGYNEQNVTDRYLTRMLADFLKPFWVRIVIVFALLLAATGLTLVLPYLVQRVAAEAMTLSPAQMLYLATRAGAEALSLEDETGDFTIGKAADLVYLKPPPASTLNTVLAHLEDPERILAAVLALADQDSVGEVRVEGDVVFEGRP